MYKYDAKNKPLHHFCVITSKMIKIVLTSLLSLSMSCNGAQSPANNEVSGLADNVEPIKEEVIMGAERWGAYSHLLESKNIALVVNQTSTVGSSHIVDAFMERNLAVKKVFAPEHGFRGSADAGEYVEDERDLKTGLPIVSLYGSNKKPSNEQLRDIDVIVFDIQDVGVRFYTYISTLHYVMQAAAENGIKVIVLDRPNPNGFYVDGPVLDKDYSSFVGMHPVALVHGMTVGEYAKMINGEGFLGDDIKCDLEVIPCLNYEHNDMYELPIPPSPNLPNYRSIMLYPSLALFEGTTVSIGRGTTDQFQVIGHPEYKVGTYSFTPTSGPGSKYPKHENKIAYGYSLKELSVAELRNDARLDLSYIIKAHNYLVKEDRFWLRNNFIDKLAGSDELRKQISAGLSEDEIRASWQDELNAFKSVRKKYLLYKDFE